MPRYLNRQRPLKGVNATIFLGTGSQSLRGAIPIRRTTSTPEVVGLRPEILASGTTRPATLSPFRFPWRPRAAFPQPLVDMAVNARTISAQMTGIDVSTQSTISETALVTLGQRYDRASGLEGVGYGSRFGLEYVDFGESRLGTEIDLPGLFSGHIAIDILPTLYVELAESSTEPEKYEAWMAAPLTYRVGSSIPRFYVEPNDHFTVFGHPLYMSLSDEDEGKYRFSIEIDKTWVDQEDE